ncbi:MAG: hypothetical protein LBC78_01865 [Oscillospiraceae bacterium]|jgi:hypothetical protein|nr:hypothetical protein [Oscillospiraceae bacterium]
MNRYFGNSGEFIRLDEGEFAQTRTPDLANPVTAATRRRREEESPPFRLKLPGGFSLSDLALMALFFALYKESGDEEFLFILAALALFR